MEGTRSALIVANDNYTDPGLRRLRAPAADARALARVLEDPHIGGFEVRTLINEPAHDINLAVEEFFADRRPDDLLVLHFSCHGVKDEGGELYFAAANTRLGRLAATAVGADFVNRRMSRSRSRRIVLLLDCCYAGAFEHGMTARAGGGLAIDTQFNGRGRAVITASSAMEYAFEGDKLTDDQGQQPSLFTSSLVQGLETGDADRDQDGLVALDELYDYVYDKVREETPNQTPCKWTFGVQGDLYIAHRNRPVTIPAPLPVELQQAVDSPLAGIRAGAVDELARLLHSRHGGLALAARRCLENLAEDDSRTVSASAQRALAADSRPVPVPPPAQPRLSLSATAITFGKVEAGSTPPEQLVKISNTGGGKLNPRVSTSARWLSLRHTGDRLFISVDATAVGQHEDVVTVVSEGGAATIRVTAEVSPPPTAGAGAHQLDAVPTPTPSATSRPSPVQHNAPHHGHPPGVPSPALYSRHEHDQAEVLATWVQRARAGVFDLVVVLPGYVVLVLGLGDVCTDDGCRPAAPRWVAWIGVAMIVAVKAYNRWYLQGKTGQSWGKRRYHLKLVRLADHHPIGFRAAVERGLAHFLDILTLGVGYLQPIWDHRRQTLADKVTKTVVVKARRPT